MSDNLKLADGDLYYIEKGKGSPVMLLHGGPGLVHDYLLQIINILATLDHKVICFDQRGNGLSSEFAIEDVTLAKVVEDIEALRRHLGYEKVSLMGHAYGCILALEYERLYPKHVDRMIFVSPTPVRLRDQKRVEKELERRLKVAMGAGLFMSRKDEENYVPELDDLKIPMTGYFHDMRKRDLYIEILRESAFSMEKYMAINEIGMEAYKKLINIKRYRVGKTALIIRGEKDFVPDAAYDEICQIFDHTHRVSINDCGHMIPVEKSRELCDIVHEYLKIGER